MASSTTTTLESVLDALKVPPDFARYEHIVDGDELVRLDGWKNTAHDELARLRDIIIDDDDARSTLPVRQQARIVSAAAAFDGEGVWVTTRSLDTAHDVLDVFSPPSLALVECILLHEIKPLFRSNPHPSINADTGRKLPRPAGGPMASQDYYEGQAWKGHPGAAHLVLWCLRHVQGVDYEKLWHLVIPPVMTFVDDYEARYKLLGVRMVSEMLKTVPQDLLRRTGMDGLVHSSLSTCLHFLQNAETSALIRAVVPTILTLIRLSTTPGSVQQFDQLSALLGDGIIGSVWMYASEDAEVVLASVEVLPPLLAEMGIGSARYLKALVPQLVHPLAPDRLRPAPVRLQISSAHALATLIDECAPRMFRWKETILEGVGKCWWTCVQEREDASSAELKCALRHVCGRLRDACPSVSEDFARLRGLDSAFASLLD